MFRERHHRFSRLILLIAGVLITPALAGQEIFITRVVASPFADGVYWYLREPLVWQAFDGNVVRVPAGFVTDFASVPKVVWSLLPKWERYGPAAVVHDYLYWSQSVPREQADRYFLEAMGDSDVPALKKRTIYGAVRLFGRLSWRANERDKQAGHIRVMQSSEWPLNPSATWRDVRDQIEKNRREAPPADTDG